MEYFDIIPKKKHLYAQSFKRLSTEKKYMPMTTELTVSKNQWKNS